MDWAEVEWKKIGEHLRQERERQGVSQMKLAAITGVSSNRISDIERGLHPSTIFKTMVDLARGLDISVGQLVDPSLCLCVSIPMAATIPCPAAALDFGTSATVEVQRSLLPLRIGRSAAFRLRGGSLVGDAIFDGEYLIVDRDAGRPDGGLHVVQVDGEVHAFHVHGHPDRTVLRSSCELREVRAVEILGRVVAAMKSMQVS